MAATETSTNEIHHPHSFQSATLLICLISVNGITVHAFRPNTYESSLTLLTLTPTPNQQILGTLLQRQMSQQLRKLAGLGAFSSTKVGAWRTEAVFQPHAGG